MKVDNGVCDGEDGDDDDNEDNGSGSEYDNDYIMK